jgi:hypothetical protein
MKNLITLFAIIISFCSFSQSNSDYNLPPGAVLKPKAKIEDLSYKLGDLQNTVSQNYVEQNFLKDFSSEDLVSMQIEAPEMYSYYMTANDFYINLSPRVKSIFTVNELWDIYYFDANLKQQISLIK